MTLHSAGIESERVPFADLSLQWTEIENAALPEIRKLFSSSAYCLGPYVARFEESIAGYLGVSHAVGVNSGTSALHLALIAAGLGRGDKVLVPAHTFIATIWAVLYVGATPVPCDVDMATATIDLADAERRIDASVKAIIPVHLYGQPADMDAVLALADQHGLTVIEDAAQAVGARYNGKCVGGFGRLGCFSFYPGKNLGAAGEAGLLTTEDAALASRIKSLRNHAQADRYVHAELGFNYRMDGLQGLVLGHKLRHLDAWTSQRRAIAARYDAGLADLPVAVPRIVNCDHVYHLYVILSERRDALRAHLAERGIDTGLHYPVPIHSQPCLAHLDMDRDSFPNADRYASQCLSLPIFSGMTHAETDRVVDAMRSFFHSG